MTDAAADRSGSGVVSATQYARIKELFVELCDLPDAERAARLERVEDDDIRRELGAMLEIDTRGGIFGAAETGRGSLAGGFRFTRGGGVRGPTRLPERIGQYRIVKLLG